MHTSPEPVTPPKRRGVGDHFFSYDVVRYYVQAHCVVCGVLSVSWSTRGEAGSCRQYGGGGDRYAL
jgi:hypothetical protein